MVLNGTVESNKLCTVMTWWNCYTLIAYMSYQVFSIFDLHSLICGRRDTNEICGRRDTNDVERSRSEIKGAENLNVLWNIKTSKVIPKSG